MPMRRLAECACVSRYLQDTRIKLNSGQVWANGTFACLLVVRTGVCLHFVSCIWQILALIVPNCMPARRSIHEMPETNSPSISGPDQWLFLPAVFFSGWAMCQCTTIHSSRRKKNGRKTTNHQSTRQETNASKMIVYAHKKCKSKLLVINQKALNLSLLRVFTPSILYHFLQQFQRNIQPLKECSKWK